MLTQIFLGAVMTLLTVAVQVIFIEIAANYMITLAARREAAEKPARPSLYLAGITLWMLLAFVLISLLWASLLVTIGALDKIQTAFYFSMVSFTTLGFGDIVLGEDWQVLSALIAANGLLVFGLNTAVIVETLRGTIKQ